MQSEFIELYNSGQNSLIVPEKTKYNLFHLKVEKYTDMYRKVNTHLVHTLTWANRLKTSAQKPIDEFAIRKIIT